MIDDEQLAARLERAVQLVEDAAGIDLRPAVRFVDPVEVVVTHEDHDQVELPGAEVEIAGLDDALADLLESPVREALLEVVLG